MKHRLASWLRRAADWLDPPQDTARYSHAQLGGGAQFALDDPCHPIDFPEPSPINCGAVHWRG